MGTGRAAASHEHPHGAASRTRARSCGGDPAPCPGTAPRPPRAPAQHGPAESKAKAVTHGCPSAAAWETPPPPRLPPLSPSRAESTGGPLPERAASPPTSSRVGPPRAEPYRAVPSRAVPCPGGPRRSRPFNQGGPELGGAAAGGVVPRLPPCPASPPPFPTPKGFSHPLPWEGGIRAGRCVFFPLFTLKCPGKEREEPSTPGSEPGPGQTPGGFLREFQKRPQCGAKRAP